VTTPTRREIVIMGSSSICDAVYWELPCVYVTYPVTPRTLQPIKYPFQEPGAAAHAVVPVVAAASRAQDLPTAIPAADAVCGDTIGRNRERSNACPSHFLLILPAIR
jgi:hypothetical protein